MTKTDEKIPKGKVGCDAKPKVDDSKVKKAGKEEVRAKILAYMAEVQTTENNSDIPKEDIAHACGFSSPGSHTFFYSWRELTTDDKVVKSGKKGCFRLTEEGLKSVPEGIIVDAPKSNAHKKLFLLKQLQRRLKGKAPADKIETIVEVLLDGKPHSLDELCKATGWSGLNTKAFGYTMSALKKQNLADECKKTYTLTDKWFPEGRP